MVNPSEKNKLRKYLFYILIFSALLFVYVFFLSPIMKKEEVSFLPVSVWNPQNIEIDFQILENPAFKELQPYLMISLPEEKIGREDLFVPLKQR